MIVSAGMGALARGSAPGSDANHPRGRPARVDGFRHRFGFARRDVTLANWRKSPFSRWSFQHLREIAPTAAMSRGSRSLATLPESPDFLAESLSLAGEMVSVEQFLRLSSTDVFLALKHGTPVLAWAAPHASFDQPHLLFSISKSLTALVLGALSGLGRLDLEASVLAFVPEAAGSAFGDATVRELLDMRVSLNVDEAYEGENGFGARYRRAVLWDPPGRHAPQTHLSLLLSIRKGADPHGGPFRYRSANSDMLGVIAERAGGKPFAQLARELLWKPLGASGEANVSVDGEGMAQTAGGMAVTARDLARVGELMRNAGRLCGRPLLPAAFLRDTLEGGDAQAWREGDFAAVLPNGRYRNQWYGTGHSSGAFYATGIFGQWLYVVPSRGVTMVKLSSQPEPKSERVGRQTLHFFEALAARL